jgi:hypothetical protein
MNENVIKMARLMVGCNDITCEDCLSQSKKLFGDNKCALIEYAEELDKAGYRKRADVAREFAEKATKAINHEWDNYNTKDKPDTYWRGKHNGLVTAKNTINDLAEQFGKEE